VGEVRKVSERRKSEGKMVKVRVRVKGRVRARARARAIEQIEYGARIYNSIPVGGLKSSPPYRLASRIFTIFLFPLKLFRVRPRNIDKRDRQTEMTGKTPIIRGT
jgi:hypothetical protein